MTKEYHQSSFRDNSGRIFFENNELKREIFKPYLENYSQLMKSGLYEELVEKKLLISHIELGANIIKPDEVFISYPYEWCFSAYKDCAIATLDIQNIALKYGMTLKDASAYNIQFKEGKPLLIDTLSFEKYEAGTPWVAYKQFCQHFLAPLVLMSQVDLRLSKLMTDFIDGIPLDITSRILPYKSKLNLGILSHIHLHAKMQKQFENKIPPKSNISKFQVLALIDNLLATVKSLEPKKQKTEWEKYYTFTNYNDEAFEQKKSIVSEFLTEVNPKTVWDFGGNTGEFSRLGKNSNIVSLDIDALAIEKSYLDMKNSHETNFLPLVYDLINPSPSIGWANEEREDLRKRAKNVDCVMALALVHHLAISNNLPLEKIAQHFSKFSKYLIVEFVEKDDKQVQKLLQTREDIFDNYNKSGFENAFTKYYNIEKTVSINNMFRTLYLMKVKK